MAEKAIGRRGFLGAAAAVGAAGVVGCEATGPEKGPTTSAVRPSKPLKVRYGLNGLVYTAAFDKSQVGLVKKVADLGYDGIEIPFNDLSLLDVKATRAALEASKMGMTACCVMMPGTAATPAANLCGTDAAERKAGVDRIKQMVDLTAEMGGDVVAGPIYSPVGYLTRRARTDEEWAWCVEGFRAAAEHAAKAKITLAIEPLNRFETYVFNTVADTTRLAKEVGSPSLKVQIDTFHCNIEEKDTPAAIRACGASLGHFHACENDRGTPGTGQVPWKEVFRALKDVNYSGWITIESFATGILDLCAAACIWRPIYDTADKLATDGLAFLKKMAAEA